MDLRSRRGGKAVFVVAAVAALALSFSAMAAFGAAPVAFKDAHFSGYASGTVVHADLLQSGGTRVANADEAFSGSAVNSDGLTKINNEVQRPVVPANAAKNSYGRGSAIEANLLAENDAEADLTLIGKSESIAPPSTNLDTQDIQLPANPLVYASLLRGQSQALWSDSQCIVGRDISFGRGHAADVQLISTSLSNVGDTAQLDQPLVATDSSFNDSGRAVASSYSHEFLDVQRDKNLKPIGTAFGTNSEARMTIAPVTLFKGTDNEITVEVAGEWVLRAAAGGTPGSAWVRYGPEDTESPSTPVVTIHQTGVANRIVTLQQLLATQTGVIIPISPVLEVRVGEDPRALGNSDPESQPAIAADGTSASGAVDVVKVVLLAPDEETHVADIRVGHMEASAKTPAGGINCGIPVTKTANPPGVTVNQSFVVTIKIDNPFGCDLTAVKVVDNITTEGGARFEVVGTNPTANVVPAGDHLASGTIVWNNIGSIPKGGTKSVTTTIKAQNVNDQGGVIADVADVSAVLGGCEGQGNGTQLVGTSLPLHVPVVLKLQLPPTGVGTSATTALAALGLLSLAGVAIRQMRRTTI
jgi:hypothetical protein